MECYRRLLHVCWKDKSYQRQYTKRRQLQREFTYVVHTIKKRKLQLLTTRQAAWYIISRASVCLYVCLSGDNFDVESSFLLVRYITRENGSSSYMKVIDQRSRSQEQKGRKSLFSQCKTAIGNNSVSIKRRVVRFASSIWGFRV